MTVTASPRIGTVMSDPHQILDQTFEQNETLQRTLLLEKQIPNGNIEAENELQAHYRSYFTRISPGQLDALVQIQSQKILQDAAVSIFMKALKDTPLKHYQSRFAQLSNCPTLAKIPYHNLFKIVYFIEKTLPIQAEKNVLYFKKGLYHIPRTLFYQKDKAIFLINEKNSKLLDTSEQYKRVRTAVRIPLQTDEPCLLCAQGVNIYKKHDTSYPAILHEIKIAKMFSGKEEIIQTLFDTTFREGKQAAIFWPYHPVTLEKLIATETLTRQAKLRLTEDLIVGLHHMHEMNILHGDIKHNNVLTYIDQSKNFRACWIDFGYSSEVSQELPWSAWKRGFYGSPYATAPEVLGTSPFKGDRFKAEMWSLGHLLYHLFFQGFNLPWSDTAAEFIARRISPYELQEEIYEHLDRFAIASPEDKFVRFIYELLHRDPKMRPNITECLTRIRQLREEKAHRKF